MVYAPAEAPEAHAPSTTETVLAALDQARKAPPLQAIVFPPCPELLTRLHKAMASAEPDLNEVARIATSDVAMSMALLKAANSAVYAAGQPARTIGQAMDRLGLDETAGVMTTFLAQRAIRIHSPQLARFWEQAGKRAVAMAFLARKLTGMSVDVAYTHGLFCHSGMAVMAQSCKGYNGTIVEAVARKDRSFVARLWQLHPEVVTAIRLHHDQDALGSSRIDNAIQNLMAAGLLADHLMREHEGLGPEPDWVRHGEAAMNWLQIDREELTGWQVELHDLMDQV
jgi:HD-like signal output (HDOD) protein